PNVTAARPSRMRRSGRSNVGTPLTSEVFGVCTLAAVKPAACLFCAVRLAMPFARLSDRLEGQNAQIVSDRVLLRLAGWWNRFPLPRITARSRRSLEITEHAETVKIGRASCRERVEG